MMAGIIDTWRGVWNAGTPYATGQWVSHPNGSSYLAVQNAAAGDDPADGGPWIYISWHSPGIIDVWRGIWSPQATYAYGDLVVRPDGNTYLAVQKPPPGQPPENGDPWVPLDARPLGNPPSADLSPNAAVVDLTGPELSRYDQIETGDLTVQQSFAFDNRDGTLYTCQIIGGGQQLPGEDAPVPYAQRVENGDLLYSRITADGTLNGKMWIKGAGHGTAFGIEEASTGGVWLWSDAASRPSGGRGFATKISRVPFTDGQVINSADTDQYDPVPGSGSVTCTIDPLTARVMYRSNISGVRTYYLYRLADARNHNFSRPIATQPEPLADPTYLQGLCSAGSSFYVYDGQSGGDITIRRANWSNGVTTQSAVMTYGSALTYREPEGLAVRIPDPSTPARFQLCYGIVSGSASDARLSVAYLETGTPARGWTLLDYDTDLYEPAPGIPAPRYLAENGRIWLSFRLQRKDGTPWPHRTVVLTLPQWLWPTRFQGITGHASGIADVMATSAQTVRYDISQTNGQIILNDRRNLTGWIGAEDGYWR